MTRKITIAILLSVMAVLVGWDIYVATNDVEGDTISEVALGLSLGNPIIPFAVGVVCGHLLWPQRNANQPLREDEENVENDPTIPS